jgi:hypothetical protein
VRVRAGRWWWVVAAGGIAAAVGVGVWLAWPSAKSAYDPPTRSRQYVAFTACLLTGPSGLSDAQASAVWKGMQTASSATRAQVTYLSAGAGQAETVGSVTPFANTLIQQHCGLILAVGAVEVKAAQAVAASNTGEHFVLVGGGTVAPNVTVVPSVGVASVSSRVASVVQDAVGGVFHAGVVS